MSITVPVVICKRRAALARQMRAQQTLTAAIYTVSAGGVCTAPANSGNAAANPGFQPDAVGFNGYNTANYFNGLPPQYGAVPAANGYSLQTEPVYEPPPFEEAIRMPQSAGNLNNAMAGPPSYEQAIHT